MSVFGTDEGTEDTGPGLPGLADAIPTATGSLALPTAERDYIIPAQDTKGHHVRLYCRAIPAIGRLVADIHASHKYPFRTLGDVVRWCVTVGAKRLASGAGINSVTAHVDAMIGILQDEEFQQAFLETFNYCNRVVSRYIESNAPGEARRVIALMRAQIEGMPEGYWQGRYRDELLERYGSLMDANGLAGEWDVETAADLDVTAALAAELSALGEAIDAEA